LLTGYDLVMSNAVAEPNFDSEKKNKEQILVEVQAAAINPVDYKAPKLMLGDLVGLDFCGVITKVGAMIESSSNENKFSVGDVVYGFTKKGSVAEYTVTHPSVIAKAPKDWKATECAALPVAYISALQCLKAGNVLSGDAENKTVLVVGASGGCGIAGLQLCKAVGVSRIIAICSNKNADYVRKYGATEVVDYTNESELDSFFVSNKGKIDCVFDAASEGKVDYCTPSFDLLKRNKKDEIFGQYTALNGSGKTWGRKFLGIEKANHHLILADQNRADLEKVVELMDKIGARPPLNEMTFDEQGFNEALKLLKSRRSKGKIVIKIK